MKLTSIIALVLLSGFSMISCVEDNFDVEGTCVTCTTATSPAETIQACANGDGTITLVENGIETTTSQNDLATFQVTQEGTGSTCN